MNPTAKNNTRKKIVLPLFCYLYPTESHLLDPKSHQEHRHIHTDACSYTECALNGKIAYLTFRNHEIRFRQKKKFLSAFRAFCEIYCLLTKISTYIVLWYAKLCGHPQHVVWVYHFCSLYSTRFHLQIYQLSLRSEHCVDVHRLLPIECLCAFLGGEEGDKLR